MALSLYQDCPYIEYPYKESLLYSHQCAFSSAKQMFTMLALKQASLCLLCSCWRCCSVMLCSSFVALLNVLWKVGIWEALSIEFSCSYMDATCSTWGTVASYLWMLTLDARSSKIPISMVTSKSLTTRQSHPCMEQFIVAVRLLGDCRVVWKTNWCKMHSERVGIVRMDLLQKCIPSKNSQVKQTLVLCHNALAMHLIAGLRFACLFCSIALDWLYWVFCSMCLPGTTDLDRYRA